MADDGELALEQWLAAALDAAGIDAPEGLTGPEAVTAVLDLARHAAHGVTRPAAPLAAFVAGLAAASSDGSLEALEGISARIGSRARTWSDDTGS